MAAMSSFRANGAPLRLPTSLLSADGPDSCVSPRSAEIERLKDVIKTKDRCMFNFAKTLRAADEKALDAERRLQEQTHRLMGGDVSAEVSRLHQELQAEQSKYKELRLVHDETSRLNRSREEALQGEIRQLAHQLSATTKKRADEIQHEMAKWKAEVHSVLEQARRELDASQDENRILRNELLASEHHAKMYRESSEERSSQIQSLQHENKQLQTRLEQAEEELKRMARDVNMSQSAFRANSSELESRVESLQLRTVWLDGLLKERERLHNESEEHRRNAEEKHAANEGLLAQAGQDLRGAQELIRKMHEEWEDAQKRYYKHEESSTKAEMEEYKTKNDNANHKAWDQQSPQKVRAAQNMQRLQRAAPPARDLQEPKQASADDMQRQQKQDHEDALSSPDTQLSPAFGSMSSPDLKEHIQHLQALLKEAMQQRDASGGRANLMEEAKVIGHERQDIVKLLDDLAAKEAEVRELTSHLVRSKGREFALTRDMQLADEKLWKAIEEKNHAHVQFEAVMQNLQGRESTGSAASPPLSPSPFDFPAISSWPRSARPPDVYSDYSPFPRARAAEEVVRLKARVVELETTLEEGKRDMIELLQEADRKDRHIQELLAASFKGSECSPQTPNHSAHPQHHVRDESHAPPPPLKDPSTTEVDASDIDRRGDSHSADTEVENEDMKSQQGPSVYASVSQGPSRRSSITSTLSHRTSPRLISLPSTPMSNGRGYFQDEIDDIYATRGNKERSPVIAESQNGEPQHFTIHGCGQGPVRITSSSSYM